MVIINKPCIQRLVLTLVLVSLLSDAVSQQNLGRQTILQFDPQNSVLKPEAPPLTESTPIELGRKSSLFVRSIGGVTFDQVASPDNNLKISKLKLDYNKNMKDGSRLELIVNGKLVKVRLPDWMLIPIANYADSPYYSCFTLFGKLNDNSLEKQITSNKGRVINYHPSFVNTLIGVRLAYMDMLLGYSFTSDLPRNANGNYILGFGEVKPDLVSNQNGAYYLSQYITSIQSKYAQTFRSYIISDYSRKITFKFQNDSLIINSYPYYYCWKFNSDNNDYDINKAARKLTAKYDQELKNISKSSAKASRKWLTDKMIILADKYDGNYGFYSEGTFTDLVKLKSTPARQQFLEKYSTESLFDMIIKTESYMNRDSVIYLKGFSDDISSKPDLFSAANPAVWNAAVNTMRFSAFFRYIKTNFPKAWFVFMEQIKTVDPEPRIFTPTIMFDPANKEIAKVLRTK